MKDFGSVHFVFVFFLDGNTRAGTMPEVLRCSSLETLLLLLTSRALFLQTLRPRANQRGGIRRRPLSSQDIDTAGPSDGDEGGGSPLLMCTINHIQLVWYPARGAVQQQASSPDESQPQWRRVRWIGSTESERVRERRGGASRQGDLHSTSSGVRMGERKRGRERKGG